RRKLSFLMKANILCVIVTMFRVYILPRIVKDFTPMFLGETYCLFDRYEINSIYLAVMSLVTAAIFVVIAVYIAESFRNHLYGGYEAEINTLSACIKYVELALVIILIYSILNIFGILKYSKPTEMECYAVSVIVILYYIFKRHKLYNRDTVRVKVREIGSEVYKSGHETIDGEKDIKVVFNGNQFRPQTINIFKENFYIVADNNILILGDKKNILYDKSLIKVISIYNGDTIDLRMVYNQQDEKWVVC
ncbi:MAG: hypothetical protein RR446_03225, partial [Lachnospiraceae bacterium]